MPRQNRQSSSTAVTLKRTFLRALALLFAAILTGCGGDKKEPSASPIPAATRAATALPTGTRTPLPPTWTPKPTLTEPPRVTYAIDYQAPTMTTFIPPTYTPSPLPTPLPPTATPPGPAVILTASVLNQTLQAQIPPEALVYIDGAPIIGFENNQMIVTLNVLRVPGEMTSARPVMIQIAIAINQGILVLSKASAVYDDDNTPYTESLADQLIQTLQGIVDEVLVTLYNQAVPDHPDFYVSEVLVSTNGLTVRTVTMP